MSNLFSPVKIGPETARMAAESISQLEATV
jgi:hypothetical protein